MQSHEQVESLLSEALELARTDYELSRIEFLAVNAESRKNAANRIRIVLAYRSALKSYGDALKDFNTFVINGIFPVRMTGDRTRAAGE
jgi:hypothetical protein